jgi:hypothetical protein
MLNATCQPGACLALSFTFMLTGILAPSAYAQSDPPVMLIVLKNQPIRKIVQGVDSQSARWRKFAEHEVRRAPVPMKAYAQQHLNAELLAESNEVIAQMKTATGPEQDMLADRLTGLGATVTRRYAGFNVLEAQIPDSALEAVKQDPAVARVVPAGENRKFFEAFEKGLSDPTQHAEISRLMRSRKCSCGSGKPAQANTLVARK